MISLPLPVFVSLILCFKLLRGIATGVARPLLVLLGLCAVQAGLASFNLIRDLPAVRFAQITTASLIAAATWIAYVTTTQRAFSMVRDGVHLIAGPVAVAMIGVIDVKILDGFLTLWFASHGVAIILSVMKGADALPNVPLETAEGAGKLWLGSAVALFTRTTELLEREKLYLDPDLNLTRIARRLNVPVKKLSAAINQSTGESVSRLINGYRIKCVCAALLSGDASITQAMFAAGFSTKSNFNAEFRRVTGLAPRDWLTNTTTNAALQH